MGSMRPCFLAFAAVAAVLPLAAAGTASPPSRPGTVSRGWIVRWPGRGSTRAYFKEFSAPPGLIRRVRVLIADRPVVGPPYLSRVACTATRRAAFAQKSWLWDGRNVYVALLLQPGRCSVAGTAVRIRVILSTVGT